MLNSLSILVLSTLALIDITLGIEYVVYPMDRKDKTACTKTTDFLNDLLFSKNVKACISDIRGVTQLWLVQAEGIQLEAIQKGPGVTAMAENSAC